MKTSRRELIRVGLGGLAVVSMGGTIPAFLSKFAYAEGPATQPAAATDNILVVVQLSGGNDGLNTVIPVTDDAYFKARPVIGIKDKVLKLNDNLALNPSMKAFKTLFDDGKLAVINGCGYPQPNRSHFESMKIWHTADPKAHETIGWLGHYIDHQLRGSISPMKAVNIGPEVPQALVTEDAPVPSIQSIEEFSVRTDRRSEADSRLEQKIIKEMNAVRDSTPAMQYLSRQATNAIIESEKIRQLTAGYKPGANYPQGIGRELQLIAQIISGNFGTRLYYCQTGGFDTHANQPQGHAQVLANVSDSIAAFYTDLKDKGIADKVTVMVFSEFGRRVGQNASNGTDHGTAGPMFVVGGAVKGGLYGAYPSLSELDNGDLKYTTDFRRVYATLLEKHLNADSTNVLGNKFEPLAFL